MYRPYFGDAATATSLSIKVREASDALTGLKKLAGLIGEAIINLDSKVGTIGGDPAAERDRRKQQVLDVLRSLNLDQQSLNQVANRDRERDLIDGAVGNRWPHQVNSEFECQHPGISTAPRAQQD